MLRQRQDLVTLQRSICTENSCVVFDVQRALKRQMRCEVAMFFVRHRCVLFVLSLVAALAGGEMWQS